MTVTPYERGRYFVSSNSGQPPYLVDLEHQDEPTDKPRCVCDCWPHKKNPAVDCSHIRAVKGTLRLLHDLEQPEK